MDLSYFDLVRTDNMLFGDSSQPSHRANSDRLFKLDLFYFYVSITGVYKNVS